MRKPARTLPKALTGIRGLDEITAGGLPRGRPTLVAGGAGCGKTLFAMEFLVRGATQFGEPGVFMSFEESEEELAANVASLGFDLPRLVKANKLALDQVRVERSEIEETGEYDLEGLFVRLQHAIDGVGAKRVALDTIEVLFATIPNPGVVRSELRRLFRWLKERGQTVVITGEKGEGTLTRHGIEEYVSDCVIVLDHRVAEQIPTRRLRVVKYRGALHGTNEYPFIIDETGFSVLPITSLGLNHRALEARLSSGVPRLDQMLGGKGYFRGSTVLVSGTAGTGKTSLAALFANKTCEAAGRCLVFNYEESPDQLLRNMRSIGLDLARHQRSGRLRIVATRPLSLGLEMHLVSMYKEIDGFAPDVVVVDPINSLLSGGPIALHLQTLVTRLVDFLKTREITALFTSLTHGSTDIEHTDVGVSSIIDTWLMLEVIRSGGERNLTMNIIKSRGMAHSNQTSEYVLSGEGMHLLDTYLGPGGVLTGSARLAQQAKDDAERARLAAELAQKRELRQSHRKVFQARKIALREELEMADAELQRSIEAGEAQLGRMAAERGRMARQRHAFAAETAGKPGRGRR